VAGRQVRESVESLIEVGGVAGGEERYGIGQVLVLCSFYCSCGQARQGRAGAAGALNEVFRCLVRRVWLVPARFGFGKTQKMPRPTRTISIIMLRHMDYGMMRRDEVWTIGCARTGWSGRRMGDLFLESPQAVKIQPANAISQCKQPSSQTPRSI
jgi:hypothetical protein